MGKAREFAGLKESTKDEIVELLIAEANRNGKTEEVDIDLDKDLSDFSKLKDKTRKEIAELMIAEDYDASSNPEQMNVSGFDGFRILKIQEFVAGERQKMHAFHSHQEEERRAKEAEFIDRELLKKNLGIQESEIEHTIKKAEPVMAFSEREKRIKDYVTGTADVNEQLRRAMQVTGTESIKDKMLKVLNINKNYHQF